MSLCVFCGLPGLALGRVAPANFLKLSPGRTVSRCKNQRPCRSFCAGRRSSQRNKARALALRTSALVNVEFNPALLLGLGVMSSGVVLYQLRQTRTAISRDTDLFISCICLCTGGILVFQGWRLDPLLLLCQLFTTTVALSYALEALQARQSSAPPQVEERRRAVDPRSRAPEPQAYEYDGQAFELPPPSSQDAYAEWAGGSEHSRWRNDNAMQAPGQAWQAEQQGQDSYYGRLESTEPSRSYEPGRSFEGRRDGREAADQGQAWQNKDKLKAQPSSLLGPAGYAYDRQRARDAAAVSEPPAKWKPGTWSSRSDIDASDEQDLDLYN